MSLSTLAHLSGRQRACVQFLQDIYEVSAALGTRTTIWGGMVVDILCGAFLRDHHDVDGFTLNLLNVKGEMAASRQGPCCDSDFEGGNAETWF
jgi:hypothetical protein